MAVLRDSGTERKELGKRDLFKGIGFGRHGTENAGIDG
jgi:hypothetical protein